MKKIKSKGKQLFNVPNTPEGQAFYESLKQYRQTGWHFTVKGRGSNRRDHGGNGMYIPSSNGDWFAVYIGGPKINQFLSEIWYVQQYKQLQSEVNYLLNENHEWEKKCDDKQFELDQSQKILVEVGKNRDLFLQKSINQSYQITALTVLSEEGWFKRLIKYIKNAY